jgi:hypothetical protein
VDHGAVIDRARAEVVQCAKELKALNEAAKVGLVTYLKAVTAPDEAETMEFEAVMERVKRASEGGGGLTEMDKDQRDYGRMGLVKVCKYVDG